MSPNYPIHSILNELKFKLKQHPTLILQAPPGAGKSTILPIELLKEDWLGNKKIILLEPRRIAAKLVAQRIADLLDEKVGQTVGYRIRFESKIGPETRIEIVTEGILTRMLQENNALEHVGVLIFDEFHERSIHADLSLVLSLQTQQILRSDLRILIMSATLDGETLSKTLGNAPLLTSQGRQFPIEIHYSDKETSLSIAAQTASAICSIYHKHAGDMLVFLPGVGEIFETERLLNEKTLNAKITPLHGNLPLSKQQEALFPDQDKKRKIVLATSIAETSLTIEGINIVVDSGYSRALRFDPKTGFTKLETIKVSKDTAEQRAGRAGRLGPGICYRLWNEASYHHFPAHRIPEILQADLSTLLLELANWGIKDINELNWITPPPSSSISKANELLCQIEALKEGKITLKGKELVRMPTHPRIASMLLYALKLNLIALATDIAAVIEEKDPLDAAQGINISLRINALRKWRKEEKTIANTKIIERIEKLASNWRSNWKVKPDNSTASDYECGKLLSYAYPDKIALKQNNSNKYRLLNGTLVHLSETDPLNFEEWIAGAHLDLRKSGGKMFLAAPILKEDILLKASSTENISWDYYRGELLSKLEIKIGELVIESTLLKSPSPKEIERVMREVILKEGIQLFNQTDKVISSITRLKTIKKWSKDEKWPDIDEANLCLMVLDYLPFNELNIKKREDFKRIDFESIFLTIMGWELMSELDKLLPEKMKVPSGSLIDIKYMEDGSPPILAARIQELFSWTATPLINEGKTKVLIHLLSPAYRPVQITQDLSSFWKNTYPEIRKELKIKYHKHYWPENPTEATAIKGPRKIT